MSISTQPPTLSGNFSYKTARQGGVWAGSAAAPPLQKMSKWRTFVESLVVNFVFLYDQKQ